MITFTSCDDFLDMKPTQSGESSGAIATLNDAKVALNGVMTSMTSSSYYGRNFLLYADAKGGDLTIYSAGRGNDALYSFNHTASTGSYSAFWSQIYYSRFNVSWLLLYVLWTNERCSRLVPCKRLFLKPPL